MLHFYTDPELLDDDIPLVPIAEPFFDRWRAGYEDDSWFKMYDHWDNAAESMMRSTDLASADVAIVPVDWYWIRGATWAHRPDRQAMEQRMINFVAEAKRLGVPTIVFFSGDRSNEKLPMDVDHVYRTSMYRSREQASDQVLPAFHEDLVEHHLDGELAERTHTPRPTVGFCGLARERTTIIDRLKRLAYYAKTYQDTGYLDVSPHYGEALRTEALDQLAKSPVVDTNTIVRDRDTFLTNNDVESRARVRREYIENLRDSDYVLCCRGSGNFSFRFYETLCMGRVPVVVDTDAPLPFADIIDWDSLIVRVDESDVDRIGSHVAAFHQNHDDESFRRLQGELRSVWLDYLRPTSFFAAVGDQFQLPVAA